MLPPAPLQSRVKVLVTVKAALGSLPEAAFGPIQAPDAVQPLASVEDHVRVEDWPETTLAGLALKLSVGGGGVTVTVTERLMLPPAPVQLRVKSLVADSGPRSSLPEVSFAPVQAPDALQPLASVEDQVRVDDWPETTLAGLALKVSVGGGGVTVTVTERLMLPPGPVQLRVKSLVAESGPRSSLPEVSFAPVQAPEALQLLASVEDQVRVDDWPETTLAGLALNESVGGGGVTVTVTERLMLPPVPLQSRVNVLVLVKAPVESLPETAFGPDQAPDAVQPVVLADVQLNVVDWPETTLVASAENVSVGAGGASTVTVTDSNAVPPAPVQVRVNVRVLERAPVGSLPESGFAPVQAPEAVQLEAFVDAQVRVDDCPEGTLVGLALNDRVGGGGVTVTVTERLMLPPPPVQLSVKVLVLVRVPVDWLPEAAFAPVHAPEAVHPPASVATQVRVDDWPETTLAGLALKDRVGGGGVTVTVTERLMLPPPPMQLSVKVLVLVSAPVDWLPEAAFAPVHAPEAVQLAASVATQVRVDDWPETTLVGLALKDRVGGGDVTVTVTKRLTVPPAPLQVRANPLVLVSAPVDSLPETALVPVQTPDAVQVSAPVDDQVRVDD